MPGEPEDDTTLPPGWSLIGKPGPYDRRYAISHDAIGPVINGLNPLRERPGRSVPEPEARPKTGPGTGSV